jgi:tripartite ATP-independent transporter DctP family solute receptor
MKSGKCYLAMVVTGIFFMGLLMWSGIVQAEVNKHVFHIGLVHSKTHILHRTAETLNSLMAKKSDGKIKLIIHYAGELGNEPEMTRMLQAGTLDFTITNTITFDSFSPVFGALNLPFLFPDKESLQSFYEQVIKPNRFPQVINEAKVIPLGMYSSGWRYMFARKEATKPEDFIGRKKRVMQTKYHIEAWKALGVNPVPLPWGEVYSALQLGTVDLGANEFPTFVLSKFYEVSPYIITTKHTQTPMLLIFSKKIYDGLQPEEQAIIREAGKEAMEYWWGKLDEYEQESMDQLKKIPGYGKKFRIVEFTDGQRAKMRDTALPVLFDKFLPELGDDAVKWFKQRGYIDPYMNKLGETTKAWLKEKVGK